MGSFVQRRSNRNQMKQAMERVTDNVLRKGLSQRQALEEAINHYKLSKYIIDVKPVSRWNTPFMYSYIYVVTELSKYLELEPPTPVEDSES